MDEIAERDALIRQLRTLARSAHYGVIKPPWKAEGDGVYDGDDYGSLVATFEDVNGHDIAVETAETVNAFAEMYALLEASPYGMEPDDGQ